MRAPPENPPHEISIADGSVRSVSWNVPNAVFQLIARKNDGLAVDVDSF